MLSLDWLVTDAPFSEGLNCLMISVSVWNEQQFQLLLAFQYNFCFESSLVNQVQSVHKSMCTVCVHTLWSELLQITYAMLSPRGHIMKNQ